ncbi:uncharacterized protein EKO05_0001061 [Ascochyta rabiei]|uniref:uncharacterized protein n=1 Tax=Didymella rabiei TaxID=5454 RepID=UPI0022042839|nr:uncharacterized protein EKO05_0001061 [Ascochyta rabiei]UPX10399.1 hypothetical protein EKO05_0001061 [Ascochyta rabiei]
MADTTHIQNEPDDFKSLIPEVYLQPSAVKLENLPEAQASRPLQAPETSQQQSDSQDEGDSLRARAEAAEERTSTAEDKVQRLKAAYYSSLSQCSRALPIRNALLRQTIERVLRKARLKKRILQMVDDLSNELVDCQEHAFAARFLTATGKDEAHFVHPAFWKNVAVCQSASASPDCERSAVISLGAL